MSIIIAGFAMLFVGAMFAWIFFLSVSGSGGSAAAIGYSWDHVMIPGAFVAIGTPLVVAGIKLKDK